MVRIQQQSDDERLDALIHRLCDELDLHLEITGWTRKTWDVYARDNRRSSKLLARVESFVLTSGEIRIYDDDAMAFAEALGTALEGDFGIGETVVIREAPPA